MAQSTCSVEGCGNRRSRKGMCHPCWKVWARDNMPPCSVDGCAEPSYCKGECESHYKNRKRAESGPKPPCEIKDCDREQQSLGLCGTHYYRQYAHGDPHKVKNVRRPNRRLTRRHERTEGGTSKLFITNEATGHVDVVLYDDADHDTMVAFNWYVSDEPRYPTATPKGQKREVRLHRVLLGCTPGDGVVVDHHNGDTLDNRRCNLREVTTRVNVGNQAIINRRGSSKYRNVHWNKKRRKWVVEFKVDKQIIFPGAFDDELEAAQFAWRYRAEHGMEPGYWPTRAPSSDPASDPVG